MTCMPTSTKTCESRIESLKSAWQSRVQAEVSICGWRWLRVKPCFTCESIFQRFMRFPALKRKHGVNRPGF